MLVKFAKLIWIFSIICFCGKIYGQRSFKAALGTGVSWYQGDLSEGINNRSYSPKISAEFGYYLTPKFILNGGIHYTRVAAADSLATNETRQKRNLHFRSPITEFRLEAIYEFSRDRKFGRQYGSGNHMTPFVSVGVSYFRMNPQAQFNGVWTALQPLGTEGQFMTSPNTAYNLWQLAIPFGIGLEYRFSKTMGVQASCTYQLLFTDFLDDVSGTFPVYEEFQDPTAQFLANPSQLPEFAPGSPRGNPNSDDSYIYVNLKLTYYFPPFR